MALGFKRLISFLKLRKVAVKSPQRFSARTKIRENANKWDKKNMDWVLRVSEDKIDNPV